MIHFVSSPADIPSEGLIGRIVVQGVIPGWPSFRQAAKVIETNGVSVLVARLHANYSEANCMWLFTEDTATDRQVVHLEDIRAVCDSATEANMLIMKSRDSVRIFNETRQRLENEFTDFAKETLVAR